MKIKNVHPKNSVQHVTEEKQQDDLERLENGGCSPTGYDSGGRDGNNTTGNVLKRQSRWDTPPDYSAVDKKDDPLYGENGFWSEHNFTSGDKLSQLTTMNNGVDQLDGEKEKGASGGKDIPMVQLKSRRCENGTNEVDVQNNNFSNSSSDAKSSTLPLAFGLPSPLLFHAAAGSPQAQKQLLASTGNISYSYLNGKEDKGAGETDLLTLMEMPPSVPRQQLQMLQQANANNTTTGTNTTNIPPPPTNPYGMGPGGQMPIYLPQRHHQNMLDRDREQRGEREREKEREREQRERRREKAKQRDKRGREVKVDELPGWIGNQEVDEIMKGLGLESLDKTAQNNTASSKKQKQKQRQQSHSAGKKGQQPPQQNRQNQQQVQRKRGTAMSSKEDSVEDMEVEIALDKVAKSAAQADRNEEGEKENMQNEEGKGRADKGGTKEKHEKNTEKSLIDRIPRRVLAQLGWSRPFTIHNPYHLHGRDPAAMSDRERRAIWDKEDPNGAVVIL